MKIKIDKLDILFSRFVRLRAGGVCEYCGKPNKRLECSHFHSRRKQSTRYDPDNACGLDFSCHQYLGEHPNIHTEFFKKRLGTERFEELNIRAEMMFPKLDKVAIKKDLEEKIKLFDSFRDL